jgi:hypothetical protein
MKLRGIQWASRGLRDFTVLFLKLITALSWTDEPMVWPGHTPGHMPCTVISYSVLSLNSHIFGPDSPVSYFVTDLESRIQGSHPSGAFQCLKKEADPASETFQLSLKS